jgi:thiol-disulfide isomerase/thioredoxin
MHATLPRALLATALLTTSCIVAAPDDTGATDTPAPPSEPECVYPASTTLQGTGSILPPMGWTRAVDNAGAFESLAMEDVFCRRGRFENANIESVFFILVAEWCPNCPDYATMVGQLTPDLEAENAMVVFVDLQTTNPPELPTTDSAQAYVSRYTANGWRVGEADGVVPGSIHNSPIWSAVPGCFVVRTSDMKVIATQEDTQFILPFLDIAKDLDADWSNPGPPAFSPNCSEADEEAGEPNDTVGAATPLSAGTPVAGGICTEAPDFFTIDLAGNWQLDLAFSNAEGDLDVYVINEATGEPLMNGQEPVGSDGTTDTESFTHSGPATIAVVGFQGASTTYTMTLTDLGAAPTP